MEIQIPSWIPIPSTFFEVTWMGLGFTLGRSCKGSDEKIRESAWYKGLSVVAQYFVNVILLFVHHWWIGALLVIYSPYSELVWLGWGLVLHDLADFPFKTYKYLKTKFS